MNLMSNVDRGPVQIYHIYSVNVSEYNDIYTMFSLNANYCRYISAYFRVLHLQIISFQMDGSKGNPK